MKRNPLNHIETTASLLENLFPLRFCTSSTLKLLMKAAMSTKNRDVVEKVEKNNWSSKRLVIITVKSLYL